MYRSDFELFYKRNKKVFSRIRLARTLITFLAISISIAAFAVMFYYYITGKDLQRFSSFFITCLAPFLFACVLCLIWTMNSYSLYIMPLIKKEISPTFRQDSIDYKYGIGTRQIETIDIDLLNKLNDSQKRLLAYSPDYLYYSDANTYDFPSTYIVTQDSTDNRKNFAMGFVYIFHNNYPIGYGIISCLCLKGMDIKPCLVRLNSLYATDFSERFKIDDKLNDSTILTPDVKQMLNDYVNAFKPTDYCLDGNKLKFSFLFLKDTVTFFAFVTKQPKLYKCYPDLQKEALRDYTCMSAAILLWEHSDTVWNSARKVPTLPEELIPLLHKTEPSVNPISHDTKSSVNPVKHDRRTGSTHYDRHLVARILSGLTLTIAFMGWGYFFYRNIYRATLSYIDPYVFGIVAISSIVAFSFGLNSQFHTKQKYVVNTILAATLLLSLSRVFGHNMYDFTDNKLHIFSTKVIGVFDIEDSPDSVLVVLQDRGKIKRFFSKYIARVPRSSNLYTLLKSGKKKEFHAYAQHITGTGFLSLTIYHSYATDQSLYHQYYGEIDGTPFGYGILFQPDGSQIEGHFYGYNFCSPCFYRNEKYTLIGRYDSDDNEFHPFLMQKPDGKNTIILWNRHKFQTVEDVTPYTQELATLYDEASTYIQTNRYKYKQARQDYETFIKRYRRYLY